MARPPRRPTTRKAPAPTVPGVGLANVQSVAQTAPVQSAETDADAALRDSVVAQFEAALREQPSMEQDELESLLSAFRDAVQETPIDAKLTPFDPGELAHTLNDLVESGVLNEDDRNAFARQFEEMLAPLQDKEVQVALEFARRCESDGQDAAYAWLEEQRAAAEESKAATQANPFEHTSAPRKDSAIRRSHRSRAPPV